MKFHWKIFHIRTDNSFAQLSEDNNIYLGLSKSSGEGAFFSYIKLEKMFFYYQQIERLSLYLSMLFDRYSTNVIIIKFP